MRRMLVGWGAILLVAALALSGCGDGDQPTDQSGTDTRPVVMTTFYPTTYFVHRIAGDLANIVCPLPDGADPIFWEPGTDALEAYQKADLVVLNGAEYEKWVVKVSLREEHVIRTAAGFADEFLKFKHAITHSHGPSGMHTHVGVDGHTWMDPINAKRQAQAILKRLKVLLPDHTAELDAGYKSLEADLDDLDSRLKKAMAAYDGQVVLASHPAYNYLARRYGWKVHNMALDPESEEQPMEAISAAADSSGAHYLLWESEPVPGAADRIARDTGLESVVISPCEGPPKSGDYMEVMRENVARLTKVLNQKG